MQQSPSKIDNRAERRLRTYLREAKGTNEEEQGTTFRRSSERVEAAPAKSSATERSVLAKT